MSLCLLLCMIFAVCYAEPAISKELYNGLISWELPWKVVPYEENLFKSWTLEDLKKLLQERPIDVTKMRGLEVPLACQPPETFDGRDKYKDCIHPPLDQANCGSCWAFSVSEVLSDKFCIGGKGVVLSPQDLNSCDSQNDACNGGSIYTGMQYAEDFGVVEEACLPYGSGAGASPPCPKYKCPTGKQWAKYRCKRGSVAALTKIADMKCALMNGPISGRFEVYEDFMQYKEGIYEFKNGSYIGGHAIKVVGWGVQNGTNYWICENSWGPDWGLKGFFQIKQGDCEIDKYMIDCQPNL